MLLYLFLFVHLSLKMLLTSIFMWIKRFWGFSILSQGWRQWPSQYTGEAQGCRPRASWDRASAFHKLFSLASHPLLNNPSRIPVQKHMLPHLKEKNMTIDVKTIATANLAIQILLFILASFGKAWMPQNLRAVMRSAFALWILSLLFGLHMYIRIWI